MPQEVAILGKMTEAHPPKTSESSSNKNDVVHRLQDILSIELFLELFVDSSLQFSML